MTSAVCTQPFFIEGLCVSCNVEIGTHPGLDDVEMVEIEVEIPSEFEVGDRVIQIGGNEGTLRGERPK